MKPTSKAEQYSKSQCVSDMDLYSYLARAPGERRLLAREVVELSAKTLRFLPGPYPARDRLIFQLYFLHNLPADQIRQCKGINLSKAGVEKVLNRLKERIRTATSAGPGGEVGQ